MGADQARAGRQATEEAFMSRSSDGDWDSNAGYLWPSWAERAIKGKRGQSYLRELESILVSMPDKRLGEGGLFEEDTLEYAPLACTLGAFRIGREVAAKKTTWEHWELNLPALFPGQDPCDSAWSSAEFGTDTLGLQRTLAWTIAEENDREGSRESPEARYERILAWVRSELVAG